MKCIRCGADAKHKDRADGQCPSCRGRFAFEPQSGDPFTDRAFQAAVERVSAKGRVAFTPRNLWWELQRRPEGAGCSTPVAVAGLIFAVGGGVFLMTLNAVAGAMIGLTMLAAVGLGVALQRWRSPKLLDFRTVEGLLQKYTAAHGEPPGLVRVKHEARAKAKDVGWDELLAYTFERCVITDTADTAALLIANDFHFENSVAVLSVDGYPSNAFEGLRKMLRQNDTLQVFVLHDCTPAGCRLARRLASDPDWFGGTGARVREVALRPDQAVKLAARTEPVVERVDPDEAISPDEARWLSQQRAYLAWLRPEQLIKRLFREINREVPTGDGGGGDGDFAGDPVFFLAATTSDGGGGSFG